MEQAYVTVIRDMMATLNGHFDRINAAGPGGADDPNAYLAAVLAFCAAVRELAVRLETTEPLPPLDGVHERIVAGLAVMADPAERFLAARAAGDIVRAEAAWQPLLAAIKGGWATLVEAGDLARRIAAGGVV